MKEANDIIDLQKEFKHVMDLVYNHWKTNSDIESILKMAWEEGIKESSNHQYVSDGTPFNNKIAAMDFTKEFEKSNHIYVYLYHRPELLKANIHGLMIKIKMRTNLILVMPLRYWIKE